MNRNTEPDSPAAPQHGWAANIETQKRIEAHGLGLTKREYFAALALQGIHAGEDASDRNFRCPKKRALEAVESAKALIEALNKQES